MNALDLLYSQGFGTRRHCIALIEEGFFELGIGAYLTTKDPLQVDTTRVVNSFVVHKDPYAEIDEIEAVIAWAKTRSPNGEDLSGLIYKVESIEWQYHPNAYVMLNKPMGIECSQKPSNWPSVYTLLPSPLRQRPRKGSSPGVQAVGRLDQDTTGLLLLSDDGQFIHKMSSPKHHVPKIYELHTEDPLEPSVCEKLINGVHLKDEYALTFAKEAKITGEFTMELTLTEGKYHQVKRMLAATGHKVTQLHRARIGPLVIDEDLTPGTWRWLSQTEIDSLFTKTA
jgi:16S rRNA pseudouridine516 synthase